MKTYSIEISANFVGTTGSYSLTALAGRTLLEGHCPEWAENRARAGDCCAVRDTRLGSGHSDEREDSSGNGGETHCVLL